VEFEWDSAKATSNRRKHGVSFEEAQSAFDDPNVDAFNDLEHSDTEDRRIAIGISNRGRLLIVSYTMRGIAVRIISARRATKTEAENHGQA
jgi:hypothetical protein